MKCKILFWTILATIVTPAFSWTSHQITINDIQNALTVYKTESGYNYSVLEPIIPMYGCFTAKNTEDAIVTFNTSEPNVFGGFLATWLFTYRDGWHAVIPVCNLESASEIEVEKTDVEGDGINEAVLKIEETFGNSRESNSYVLIKFKKMNVKPLMCVDTLFNDYLHEAESGFLIEPGKREGGFKHDKDIALVDWDQDGVKDILTVSKETKKRTIYKFNGSKFVVTK